MADYRSWCLKDMTRIASTECASLRSEKRACRKSNQILNRIKMFNIIETSCPYNNWVITARKLCADPDRYHCLIDEFSRPGWICTDPIWVEAETVFRCVTEPL
uniref:Uncharacterized protein n=1 Tax=Magallana gigas TaxID=29159 RepID=K1PLG9_MAGGI